jgi:hypothetical protein
LYFVQLFWVFGKTRHEVKRGTVFVPLQLLVMICRGTLGDSGVVKQDSFGQPIQSRGCDVAGLADSSKLHKLEDYFKNPSKTPSIPFDQKAGNSLLC